MISQPTTDKRFIHSKHLHLRDSSLRWFFLSLICFMTFGMYYCGDTISILQKNIDQSLGIDTLQFNIFYSVYSFPNVLIAFLGGLMIDYLGAVKSAIICSILVILGQSIIALGIHNLDFGLMILGRGVFGMGAETLVSAQTVLGVKWFLEKELAFALGLTLCVAKLGTSLDAILSPYLLNWADLTTPFVVGVGICLLSALTIVPIGILDKRADDKEGGDLKMESEKISLKDIKSFKKIYFLLLFTCIFLNGAYYGLTNNLSDILQTRFGFDETSAGQIISPVFLAAAILSPMIGLYVDKFGKRISLMLYSALVFLFSNLFIAFLHDTNPGNPNYYTIVTLIGVCIFYSFFTSIFWPCVPLVVEPHLKGTAYGFITCLLNGMQATVPIIVGAINKATLDVNFGYFWTEIFLSGLLGLGIGATVFLLIEDKKTGKRMEKGNSSNEKKILEEFKSVTY